MCTPTAVPVVDVVAGHTALCAVCLARCATWWRGADFYACVHDRCVEALTAQVPALAARGAAGVSETAGRHRDAAPRRSAYARRGGSVGGVSLFIPSRFTIPGAGWRVLAETNAGHRAVPCGGNVGHAVRVMREWATLTGLEWPIAAGGIRAAGAALFDPGGAVFLSFGFVPTPGVPAWEPLTRVSAWGSCPGCQAWLWPGRWVVARGGRCRLCAPVDGRVWPFEADFPGEGHMPDDMRDDVPRRSRRRTPKEFSRADHA
jgi:hypothetical protein